MATMNGRAVPSIAGIWFMVGDQVLHILDGWTAFARYEPYRVDWRMANGRWIRGPVLTEPRITLTPEVANVAREVEADRIGHPLPKIKRIPPSWPKHLPAFPDQPLIALPDGRVLVERLAYSRPINTRYDVVTREGTRQSQIVLPAGQRILGISADWFYILRTDEDGIQWIQKHPWPAIR
jgi:hypothetical protein